MAQSDNRVRMPWRSALEVIATLAMTTASVVLIWAILTSPDANSAAVQVTPQPPRPTKPIPDAPVALAGAPLLGNPSARVAVIEFSDYECPFCARFHESTLPAIQKSHIDTGRVLLAFRHLPLERHPLAMKAAEAAECAARVGKFWALHTELFKAPISLDEPSILAKGARIGLDENVLRECLKAGSRDRIEQDRGQARELGITGTPSFLIGIVQPDRTVRVIRHESGAIPAPVFARMLDDALQKAGSTPE